MTKSARTRDELLHDLEAAIDLIEDSTCELERSRTATSDVRFEFRRARRQARMAVVMLLDEALAR